ncbi:MAG: glycosyltransferase, partial [Caldimicrobium sp.]
VNEKHELRLKMFKDLQVPNDAYVVLSVGELNHNKNHESIIRAIAKLKDQNIYYIICGHGYLGEYLEKLSSNLGVSDRVKLLGFRSDIPKILKVADSFAFPSKREGLGLAALEAMASGLPIITSNVHGIVDYSINGKTGINCHPNDIEGFAVAIKTLKKNRDLSEKLSKNNVEVVKNFDVNNAKKVIKEIYSQF